MADVELIIKTLDKYLEANHLAEITAVQANEVLKRAGVLNDSCGRPGAPLRAVLRDNLIPNAEYRIKPHNIRGNWFIHHS